MSGEVRSRCAVFVDRDGVINELVPDPVSGHSESPLRPEDVVLIDGAGAALAQLRGAGFSLIGASNQPAAAKGTVTVAALMAVHARVLDLLRGEGVSFDAFELCLHHPEGTVAALSGDCQCRKPAPGMLLAAAGRLQIDLAGSWMVGDTDADIAAGRAAGARTILIEHPGSAHKRRGKPQPDAAVPDLRTGIQVILGTHPLCSARCQ